MVTKHGIGSGGGERLVTSCLLPRDRATNAGIQAAFLLSHSYSRTQVCGGRVTYIKGRSYLFC